MDRATIRLTIHFVTVLQKIYKIARKEAALETELPLNIFPEDCPYAWEQIIG
jgi:hypothetical protein